MRPSTVILARTEAERFLRKADALLGTLEAGYKDYGFSGSKQSAACKRASLDLTRALAVMRRFD
jgi:hypothetical protein